MTTVAPTRPLAAAFPTEDAPEVGVACLYGIDLAEAEYFVVDGDHVFRGREFDVIAGAPTFEGALDKFVREVYGFAEYLIEIKDPALNDEEMFRRLTARFLRVWRARVEYKKAQRARGRRLLGYTLTRDRSASDDPVKWRPSSRQAGSSRPSLA